MSLGNSVFKWKWAITTAASFAKEFKHMTLLWKLWFTNPRNQPVTASGKAIPVR